MIARPKKLRDGTWGAIVEGRNAGTVMDGQTVTIQTAGGKIWDARVSRVIWRGDKVAILETESLPRGGWGNQHHVGSGWYDSADRCPCSGGECNCGSDAPCCMCD